MKTNQEFRRNLRLSERGNAALAGLIPIVVVILIVLWVFGSMIVIVDSGHVGVVRRLGAVQTEALPEGFHFKRPLMDTVDQVDVRLMPSHSRATAASKDLQTVTTQVTVQYSLTSTLVSRVYKNVGVTEKVSAAIVEPAIQESVKAVTAKFTAEELVTKRELVKQQIQQTLEAFINNTLREKGLENSITIANVAITDFNFSDEFNRAIEAKVKAEQMALQAKNEKIMRVTQAEASSAERRLAAEAAAYTIEQESVARANAIKREAEALRQSPEIIHLRAIEKWDGILPKIQGSGILPFLNLGSVDENTSSAPPAQSR